MHAALIGGRLSRKSVLNKIFGVKESLPELECENAKHNTSTIQLQYRGYAFKEKVSRNLNISVPF